MTFKILTKKDKIGERGDIVVNGKVIKNKNNLPASYFRIWGFLSKKQGLDFINNHDEIKRKPRNTKLHYYFRDIVKPMMISVKKEKKPRKQREESKLKIDMKGNRQVKNIIKQIEKEDKEIKQIEKDNEEAKKIQKEQERKLKKIEYNEGKIRESIFLAYDNELNKLNEKYNEELASITKDKINKYVVSVQYDPYIFTWGYDYKKENNINRKISMVFLEGIYFIYDDRIRNGDFSNFTNTIDNYYIHNDDEQKAKSVKIPHNILNNVNKLYMKTFEVTLKDSEIKLFKKEINNEFKKKTETNKKILITRANIAKKEFDAELDKRVTEHITFMGNFLGVSETEIQNTIFNIKKIVSENIYTFNKLNDYEKFFSVPIDYYIDSANKQFGTKIEKNKGYGKKYIAKVVEHKLMEIDKKQEGETLGLIISFFDDIPAKYAKEFKIPLKYLNKDNFIPKNFPYKFIITKNKEGKKEIVKTNIKLFDMIHNNTHICDDIEHTEDVTDKLTKEENYKFFKGDIKNLITDYDVHYADGYYNFFAIGIHGKAKIHLEKVDEVMGGMMQMPLYSSSMILKINSIPADYSYDEFNNKCVPTILSKYFEMDYNKTIESLDEYDLNCNKENEDDDYDCCVMNGKIIKSDKQEKGYTGNHIKYFCEKYDISLYMYDIMNNLLSKNISNNRNRKCLICYITSSHFYIVTDEDVRKNILGVESSKTRTITYRNNLVANNMEFKQTDFINYDDEMIDEIVDYVFYEHNNKKETHLSCKEFFKKSSEGGNQLTIIYNSQNGNCLKCGNNINYKQLKKGGVTTSGFYGKNEDGNINIYCYGCIFPAKYYIVNGKNDLRQILYELYRRTEILYNKSLRAEMNGSGNDIIHEITLPSNVKIGLNPNKNPKTKKCIDYKYVQNICNKIGLSFINQSHPCLSSNLKQIFYNENNNSLMGIHKNLKETVLKNQNYLCYVCKDPLEDNTGKLNFIKSIGKGGKNEINNIYLNCRTCLINEMEEQGTKFFNDPFLSFFNSHTNNIINSDLIKQWAFVQKIGDELMNSKQYEIDMAKCYRNTLLYSGYEYPVYSSCDDVEPFTGSEFDKMPGYYYIESNNIFPLRGTGWYPYPMANYCIKQKIINYEDIKFKWIASIKLESDFFKDFVNFVVEMCGTNDENEILTGKSVINCFIGQMGKKDVEVTQKIFSNNFKEILYFYYMNREAGNVCNIVNNQSVFELGYKKTSKNFGSYLPIYYYIIGMSNCHMYSLNNKLKKMGFGPYFISTDCIKFNVLDGDINELKHYVNNTFWDSDKKIKKYHKVTEASEHFITILENYKRLETYKQIPEFKYNIIHEDDYDMNFNIEEEKKLFNKIAENIINNNLSVFIQGWGGVGKTYLCNTIKNILKEREKKFIQLSPTNISALAAKGETLAKFFMCAFSSNKNVYNTVYKFDYIFLDEISMISDYEFSGLMYLKTIRPELIFILSGDFGQLGVVADRMGKNYNYVNKRVLYDLTGNKILLKKLRRAENDAKRLYDYQKDIRNGEIIDISKFKSQSKFYYNIVKTNEKRIKLNNELMIRYCNNEKTGTAKGLKTALFIPVPENKKFKKNTVQDVYLKRGMPIISKKTVKNKHGSLLNNETFKIHNIEGSTIVIKSQIRDFCGIPFSDKKNHIINFNNEFIIFDAQHFHFYFRIAFALTIYSVQGITIRENYMIHNWDMLDKKDKYVAFSRSSKMEYIHISNEKEQLQNINEIDEDMGVNCDYDYEEDYEMDYE